MTTIPFRLRGAEGLVTVHYGANEDPVRWGYPVLQLDWFRPELVRGFPVMQASVEHPAEGYAADMGWLQVVRYGVRDPGEEGTVTVFDTPPQLAETETPCCSRNHRPVSAAVMAPASQWCGSRAPTREDPLLLSRLNARAGRCAAGAAPIHAFQQRRVPLP